MSDGYFFVRYPVIHHPPKEISEEMLQARENLILFIQTFLKKFNRISFRETPKVLTQAWDNFFEIQHAQSEDTHELIRKLLEDFQIINEELAEYINSPSWNRPAFYDDDDDEYSIQVGEKSPIAIAPVLPTEEPKNSLSMGDGHLNTIPEMESDEVIKSSVEDLVLIPNTSIVYSPKIDSLLEEFTDELAHIDPIPPGIDETDYDPKDDIRFIDVAMESILGEPCVYVPNVLPTHPTLYQDSDFSSSDDSLRSGLEVSFPSGTSDPS
nr:hypothetical protein [Tanacetum cinerariifolium]